MKFLLLLQLSVALAASNLSAQTSSPMPAPSKKTLSWSQLSAMPLPPAGERIKYGDGAQQFGELRVPKGDGNFPVVILIHGGCWQSEFDYVYITRLAAWLTDHGVATWTIEYRRLGDKGGGWPGTFLDVAQAADFLREISSLHHLDTQRVYAAGHSAGGQLALWLAARTKVPAASEIYRPNPIAIRGVLGLAAITDLAQYRVGPAGSCNASVDQLLGGEPKKFPQRYAQTSPRELLPLGVPQVFIQGERDPIVPPSSVRSYLSEARRKGDRVLELSLPTAGHFETSVPLPEMEPLLQQALDFLLKEKS